MNGWTMVAVAVVVVVVGDSGFGGALFAIVCLFWTDVNVSSWGLEVGPPMMCCGCCVAICTPT